MPWKVLFCDPFEAEFEALDIVVKDHVLKCARFLADFGPQLGRPLADTLKGSRHKNMKELRFNAADGVWRVAFAFDPERNAILLIAGDKSGGSSDKFYKGLIEEADRRFENHLKTLAKEAIK